ncbi:MAG: four helix bundle protein [Patescibacteria group bacterium]
MNSKLLVVDGKFKKSLIAQKSYDFALQVIRILKLLDKDSANLILIRQLIMSVTSIGANIEEALGSNSKKEFIHSMNIAKKEARESLYWLRLLRDLNFSNKEKFEELLSEAEEIVKILTKIVKTSGNNQGLRTNNL